MEGPGKFQKLPSVFDQTICHENSPLRSFPQQQTTANNANTNDNNQNGYGIFKNKDGVDLASVDDWYNRFLYLALHWKFHRPALDEYRARKTCAETDAKDRTNHLQSFMSQHQIGRMDFECKDAKFIVIPMASIGFGAFLNTRAILSILVALRTNRIPIFSSKSFSKAIKKRKGDQDPWELAPTHCDRKDMQCYFLPMSPCALTKEDLANATIYGSTQQEQTSLRKNVTIPLELENERIIVLYASLAVKTMDSPDMRVIAYNAVADLLGE